MPELKVSLPHQLSQEEALQRVKSLMEKIRSQHADKISNLQEDWNGDTGTFRFQVMGFQVSGALTAGKNSVELDSDIPLPALFFKSKIVSLIEDEGRKLLS